MNTSKSTHRHRSVALVAAGAVALALTGCTSSFDAWAVTYEVTVTGATAADLSAVSYAEEDGRYGPSSKIELGDVDVADTESMWSRDVVISASQWSYVTATPVGDGVASCRILLDGEREIESATAAAGQPVTCSVPTPSFE